MGKFLRKYLKLLKYASVIIAGGLYIWVITILLENNNWVGISALTTMLLAIAAFWTIWDRREQEKRDRKERLLNEIIEWATDVATCEFSVNIQEPPPIFSRLYEKEFREYGFEDKGKLLQGIMQDHKRFWLNHYMNLHSNYQTLGIKGEYVLSLCDAKYLTNIINSVRAIKAQISDYENELWEYMKDIDDESKKDKLENKAKELHTSAVELIKEATKIKTKDIG